MVLYLALMAGTVALKSQEAWLSQTGTDAQFAPEYSVCEKYPRVLEMDEMVAMFRESLHERDAEKLSIWMSRYEYSSFTHIRSFINGLKRDWEAVRNGFAYTYNSGFVEGTINKLKMMKRMMYGRAGYPLLRAKILVPWQQQGIDSRMLY